MSISRLNIDIGNIYKGSKNIGKIYRNNILMYRRPLYKNNVKTTYNITYVVDSNVTYTEAIEQNTSILSPITFIPSKSGWTFAGWRKDTTASSSVLTSEVATENTTLYAVFKQTVTASFRHNPSTIKVTTVTGDRYYNNGNEINASVTAPTGETAGDWVWRGWSAANTTTGNASAAYANGVTISDLTENVTYYGLYQIPIIATFASYKNTQTVTGARYWNASGTFVNASVTVPTGATISGWTWRGWSAAGSTAANAAVAYANGATISGLTANATYYGLYSGTATISFNGNGNTGGSTASKTATHYLSGSGQQNAPTITLPSNGFTKSGHNFSKWALGSASGTQYAPGATFTVTAFSHVFYAIWTAASQPFSGSLYQWDDGADAYSGYYGSGYSSFSINCTATKNSSNGHDPIEDGGDTYDYGYVRLYGANGKTTDVVGRSYEDRSGSASGSLSTYGGSFRVEARGGWAGQVSFSGTLYP